MTWQEFLKRSDQDMVRNDLYRGMAYSTDPSMLTKDAVEEFVTGFGYRGVSYREITDRVGRDPRGVKRALHALVDDGVLRVTEQETRGPKASKRKLYHPIESAGPPCMGYDDALQL